MRTYTVLCEELLRYEVEVEADSSEEAIEYVQEHLPSRHDVWDSEFISFQTDTLEEEE